MDDLHCDPKRLLETSSRVVEGRRTVVVGLVLYQHETWTRMGGLVSVVLMLQRDATATAYKRIGLIREPLSRMISEGIPEETITII